MDALPTVVARMAAVPMAAALTALALIGAAVVMATLGILALCIRAADVFTWPVRGTK